MGDDDCFIKPDLPSHHMLLFMLRYILDGCFVDYPIL